MTLVALHDGPVTPSELRAEMRISATRLAALVNLLEQAEALEVTDDGALAVVAGAPAHADAAEHAMEIAEAHRRMDRSRLEMMRGYAETSGCRRQYLLGYFGEEFPSTCGACDICRAGRTTEAPDGDASPYPVNSKVEHREWGGAA